MKWKGYVLVMYEKDGWWRVQRKRRHGERQ